MNIDIAQSSIEHHMQWWLALLTPEQKTELCIKLRIRLLDVANAAESEAQQAKTR